MQNSCAFHLNTTLNLTVHLHLWQKMVSLSAIALSALTEILPLNECNRDACSTVLAG